MKSDKPWDIYTEQLMPLGYGYPLWAPDQPKGRGILIGDVGYVREGEFFPLFNALEDDENARPHHSTPVDFAPLSRDTLSIAPPREKIRQRMLCSGTTHELAASIGGQGDRASPRSEYSYLSRAATGSAGAILMPHPSVEAHDIQSRLHVEEYMTANFESWLEFANHKLGIGLEPEELHFVVGTKKTRRWMVAAFRGEYFRDQSGSLAATFGQDAGSLSLSLSIAYGKLAQKHYRHGPTDRIPDYYVEEMLAMPTQFELKPLPALPPSARDPAVRHAMSQDSADFDQCLFINTASFKVKRATLVAALQLSRGTSYELTHIPADSTVQHAGRERPVERTLCAAVPPSRMVTSANAHTVAPIREEAHGIYSGITPFLKCGSCISSGSRPHETSPSAPFPASSYSGISPDRRRKPPSRRRNCLVAESPQSERSSPVRQTDPIALLQDYILKKSEATIAIASDLTLYALLGDNWPEDFPTVFSRIRPSIAVSESGVGTVVLA